MALVVWMNQNPIKEYMGVFIQTRPWSVKANMNHSRMKINIKSNSNTWHIISLDFIAFEFPG